MLIRWPRIAALAGIAALAVLVLITAVAAAAAPPNAPSAAGEKRYRACMEMTATDARKALAEANAWVKAGGADAAEHCAAAAKMALGQYDEAAETLQTLARHGGAEVAGNPALHASLWGQAAHAWLAADRPEQAEAAATEGVQLLPRNADLLVLRARARAEQKRLDDAYVDLDNAIHLDPSLTEAYVFRGSILRQRGALDAAAADLDKALTLDPDQPEALLERGMVRRMRDDDAGARADWERLDMVAPKTPAAEAARLNLEKMQQEK